MRHFDWTKGDLRCQKWSSLGNFKKKNLQSNSVTRQVTFNKAKIVGKCQKYKKCDILSNFQTLWFWLSMASLLF